MFGWLGSRPRDPGPGRVDPGLEDETPATRPFGTTVSAGLGLSSSAAALLAGGRGDRRVRARLTEVVQGVAADHAVGVREVGAEERLAGVEPGREATRERGVELDGRLGHGRAKQHMAEPRGP